MKYTDSDHKSNTIDKPVDQEPEVPKQSFAKRFKIFVLHPTVWRIILLAVAVTTTILTGGAIIPLVTLIATAITSLISVVGKTLQNRSLERTKMQHGLTKVMEKREKDIQDLRKSHAKVFDALSKEGGPFEQKSVLHEIKNIKPESKVWSVARVLSFIGAEQFWSVALLFSAANPVGLAVYIGGLVLGTAVIKSEYSNRVAEEQAKSQLKEEINMRCKMLNIAPYSNEQGLYVQFKERMINYKAVELLCKEKLDGRTEEEIVARFQEIKVQVSKEITFGNIPEKISLGRNLLNAINPFKEENAVRTFNIDFDENKVAYEMRGEYEKITHSGRLHDQDPKDVDVSSVREILGRASVSLDSNIMPSLDEVKGKFQHAQLQDSEEQREEQRIAPKEKTRHR